MTLSKAEVFQKLLQLGEARICLYLVPLHVAGLPAHLRTRDHVRLDFLTGAAGPVNPPMRAEVTGEFLVISGMAFGGSVHLVTIPWSSIYVICDETGVGGLWEADAPKPTRQTQMLPPPPKGAPPKGPAKPRPAWFKGVILGGRHGAA